jgi:putative sugar O-methyltransferase
MKQSSVSAAISRAQSFKPMQSSYFNISKGWEDLFLARSTLKPKSLLNFLNPSENVATGLALQNNDQKQEAIAFQRLCKIIERSNHSFHERATHVNGEGKFGEPLKKYRSQLLSRSNLVNLESFNQMCIALEGCFDKKINVLEIGGGYGELARQTIKYSEFDIGSWHCVDLPQNLLVAEFYLGSIFGKDSIGKTCFFKKQDFDKAEEHNTKLNFYAP